MLAPAADVRVAPDPSAEALRRALPEADFLVVRTMLPADLLDTSHRLQGIVRHGTGLDMVPLEAATRQGIPVANVPGANAQAVAEYVVGTFFQLARRFASLDATLRHDGWSASRKLAGSAMELAGRTVGIIGVGDIGSRIARICALGLDMKVLAHQRRTSRLPKYVRSVSLDELMARSDFVTLNCPLTAETYQMIDARRLGLMKPTAFLVNGARGEVVDEAALVRALREHAIAGAAVDVYAVQPLTPAHPFLGLSNILLSPHVASLTEESARAMSLGTAERLLNLMRGEQPPDLVNPEVWPSWTQRHKARNRNDRVHDG
jgi:D-3-phosphoglycerate dehydrogenase / 2-oxoglutarate reductase